MTPPEEPLTPVEIESRLRRGITILTQAQQQLRAAREAETDAELAYRKAVWAASLSPDCPTVGRASGDATVAVRDAWVGQRTYPEWETYRRAEVVREAAQDHLRTTRDIIEVLRSLGASVRTAYDVAGHAGSR